MKQKLDKSSPQPLYLQLAEAIKNSIYNGLYPEGSKIPSEQDLIKMYNVSRITVRQTMKHLETRGIVIRKQGIGTFINKPFVSQNVDDIMGFYTSLISKNDQFKMKILEYDIIKPDTETRSLLAINSGETVLKYTRQYFTRETILGVCQVHIPFTISQNWTKEDASQKNSFRLLQEDANITIINSCLKIRASLAKNKIAKFLGVSRGSAVLELSRLTYSINQQPVEYSIFSFCGDTYELTTKIFAGENNLFKLIKT